MKALFLTLLEKVIEECLCPLADVLRNFLDKDLSLTKHC